MIDELPRRHWFHALLLTALALLAYRLGTFIPLQGIDAGALTEMLRLGGFGMERLSLFALGIIPMFSALLIVEIGRLVVPRIARATAGDRGSAIRLTLWLALSLAVFQAAGMTTALEQAPHVVPTPGLQFRIATVATLVAAVALTIWLADEITRRGVGSGFWLLLCVPLLAGLPRSIATGAELQRTGMIDSSSWLAATLYCALGAAAIVALDRARSPDQPSLRLATPWPPILAFTVLGWLAALVFAVVPSGASDPRSMWYGPGQPLYLAVLAALVMLFAVLHLLRSPQAAALPRQRVFHLGVMAGAAQAGIAVAGELAQQLSPIAIDGMWLTIVVTLMLRVRDGMAN